MLCNLEIIAFKKNPLTAKFMASPNLGCPQNFFINYFQIGQHVALLHILINNLHEMVVLTKGSEACSIASEFSF